jgi:hypothetical protein
MNVGGAAAATIGVAIAAKRKRIYRLFRAAGATTASDAKSLQEINVSGSLMLNLLIRHGEIVKVDGDRYYIDESAVQACRRKRLIAVVIAILIVVTAMVVAKYLV